MVAQIGISRSCKRGARALAHDVGGDVLDEAATSPSPSSAGTSRTATAPAPNGSSTRPSSASSSALLGERRRLVVAEVDDDRHQQPLAGDAAVRQHRLQPLVDEALVRRVLVDDDDAVARLGDDIVLVQLRAGGAERPVLQRLGDGHR